MPNRSAVPSLRRLPAFALPQVLTLTVLATVAFDIRLSLFSLHTVPVPLLLFEFPLAALVAWAPVDLARKKRRPQGWISSLAILLAMLFFISVIVHPSPFALLRLYRFASAAAFGYWLVVVAAGNGRKALLFVAAAAGLFQAYLAAGQHLLGKGMGYTFLGEAEYLLPAAEGVPPFVHGTFPLHHILVGLTMVVVALLLDAPVTEPPNRQRAWLLVLSGVAIPIGFAYSRMGALAWFAVVAVLGVAGIKRPRPNLLICVALLIGGLVPAVIGFEGWLTKASETVRGDGLDDEGADVGGRGKLAREGIVVLRDQPLVGTGIGRYADQEGRMPPQLVHNVPLLIAAENGVLAGVVALILLILIGSRSTRAGPIPLAAFLSYLPFVLFDHFPYEDTQGIALAGVWMAAVAIGNNARSAP